MLPPVVPNLHQLSSRQTLFHLSFTDEGALTLPLSNPQKVDTVVDFISVHSTNENDCTSQLPLMLIDTPLSGSRCSAIRVASL